MSCYEPVAAIAAKKGFKEADPGQFVGVVKVLGASASPIEVVLTITCAREWIELIAYNWRDRRTAKFAVTPLMVETAKFNLIQLHLDLLTKEVTEP